MIGGIQRKDWGDITASRPLSSSHWPPVLEAATILIIGANSKLIWSEYIHQSNCPSARPACSHNGARLPVAFIVSLQRQPTLPSLTQFILDVGINYKLIWFDHFWRLDRNSWCRGGRTNKFDSKKFFFAFWPVWQNAISNRGHGVTSNKTHPNEIQPGHTGRHVLLKLLFSDRHILWKQA